MVSGKRGDADHGHFLEVGAVVTGGLQAVERELRGDVFGGDVAAALADAAAFEQVAREKLDVRANFFRIDRRMLRLLRRPVSRCWVWAAR